MAPKKKNRNANILGSLAGQFAGLGAGMMSGAAGTATGQLPPGIKLGPGDSYDPGTGTYTDYNEQTGRVNTSRRVPAVDFLGNPTGESTWEEVDSYFPQDASESGSSAYNAQLDYQLGLKGLEVDWANVANNREQTAVQRMQAAENIRANMAAEVESRKGRALTAASAAVEAYLTGTQLSDARRLNAMQQATALLPSMVDPNQKFFAGQEPGGPLATAASRFGLPFTPQKIQHTQMAPGMLAQTPTKQDVGSDIISGIDQVRRAGSA